MRKPSKISIITRIIIIIIFIFTIISLLRDGPGYETHRRRHKCNLTGREGAFCEHYNGFMTK